MREKAITPVRIFEKGMKAPVDIAGAVIGRGTSRSDSRDRWAEVEVWKLEGGSYLAHRTGRSLVYHRADTSCTTRDRRPRGDYASVDDLPDDAMPCPECSPPFPEDLPDGQYACRFEFPRHSFDVCEDAAAVVHKLTLNRRRDGTTTFEYSQPVTDALAECARNDPAFAGQTAPPVSFG